jgi:hypothetical protein
MGRFGCIIASSHERSWPSSTGISAILLISKRQLTTSGGCVIQVKSIIMSTSIRLESAPHISGSISLPWLLVRLTNTVNLSSVSLNATSSGLVSLHVSSDRVVVIDWTLMTLILRSLASCLVCSEEKSDLSLLWKRSLITEIEPALPPLYQ